MSEIQNIEATPTAKTVAAPTSSNTTSALLTGAALLGGAALLARPKAARAQSANKTPITFTPATFGQGDFGVLNYALSLEALEADLYVQALQRLTGGGTNALGRTITGLNQPTSSPAVDYLQQFGQVENAHRNFLNGALGNASILSPGKALDGAKFDFGLDDTAKYPDTASVVELVRLAEATGVKAYTGAVTYFSSANSPYLQTAAAIEGTEARHTAVITAILNGLTGNPMPVAPLANQNGGRETFLPPDAVLAMVRPFIVLKGEAGNP